MTRPLPCPFCGAPPFVGPEDPKTEGDAWAVVECRNADCHAAVGVEIHDIGDEEAGRSGRELSDLYKAAAVARWNERKEGR
jgi:hypothetical protein